MNEKDVFHIISLLGCAVRHCLVDNDGFIVEKHGIWYKYKNLAINSYDLSMHVIPNDYPIEDYCSMPTLQGNNLYVFGKNYNKCGEYDWNMTGKWVKCFEDMVSWLELEDKKIYLIKRENKDYDFFNNLF